MSSNTETKEGGLEQMLKGFTLLPSVVDLLQEQGRQIAALRADVAALRGKRERETEKKWLRLREAADVLNTSTKTVRRYIERGFLRRSAASRHILIPSEDVAGLRNRVVL